MRNFYHLYNNIWPWVSIGSLISMHVLHALSLFVSLSLSLSFSLGAHHAIIIVYIHCRFVMQKVAIDIILHHDVKFIIFIGKFAIKKV